jgi:hypothetical protein
MLRSGDVVPANFPGVVGTKKRPCVVVSTDDYHAHRPDVILGLLTTQIPERSIHPTTCFRTGARQDCINLRHFAHFCSRRRLYECRLLDGFPIAMFKAFEPPLSRRLR